MASAHKYSAVTLHSVLSFAEGPHGVPPASSVQQAGTSLGDEQTLADMTGQPDNSLEVAGFAGTVAEAYASFDYV